jgi:hypothetical protein
MPAQVTPDVANLRASDLYPEVGSPLEGTWSYGQLTPFSATPPAVLGTPAEAVSFQALATAQSKAGQMGGFAAWLTPGTPAFAILVMAGALYALSHLEHKRGRKH